MSEATSTDLRDLDPDVVDGIIANADVFIAVDEYVDKIIAWGEGELKFRENEIMTSGGTVEDFKKAAVEIEVQVAEQLKKLEQSVQKKYEDQPK